MRRTIATLTLALLVAFPAVAPATAVEPVASETPASEPSITPSPEPAIDPSAPPSPAPSDEAPPVVDAPAPEGSPSDPPAVDPATPEPPAEAPAGSPVADDASTTGRLDPTDRYIVVLKDGADTTSVVTRHRQREGTRADRRFSRTFRGFSAKLDRDQRLALLTDPNVAAIVPDEVIELAAQTTPTGVSRVGAKSSATAAIDGIDQRVDADVAIVDTGIARHVDLNVAGGYNCSTSDRTLWRDKQGHGTHVAGTVGALDNDFGVVGVAPGVRLWAVKILNDEGFGYLSWYVCGLDWILAQRDPSDASRPLFEAVNMSVAKWGTDDRTCGVASKDILHAAVCRVVAGGITVVAAAANDSGSASRRVPAAYNEVMTISALADTDGKPGGLGGNRCYSWGSYDKDDTFANFSNYGHDVDLIAPGKCIWSTLPGDRYAYMSGTSMAAPAVAGAVALYKASRPAATPAEVKEALQYLGNLGWNTATDPDGTHEKLLDVSRISKLGTFDFASTSLSASTGEASGTVSVPVRLTRSATFFERVRFSLTGVPAGWTASLAPTSLTGWTANTTTLSVKVPAGLPAGRYHIGVTATNQGRVKTTTVAIDVTNDAPTATAPTARPVNGSVVAVNGDRVPTGVTMRVSWPAATDPSSRIVAYELERSTNGGAWTRIATLAASKRSVDLNLSMASSHRFRVRAKDEPGNWSPWATGPTIGFRSIGDRSTSLTYAGTWKRATVDSATNRVRTSSTQAGATVRTTFTGRAIAIVMPRSSVRGKFTVWLDGVQVATVDTYAKSGQGRRIVWSKTWKSSATHQLLLRVSGTPGRRIVSLDGLIVTK
jgi:subtilisin